jgi:hypothetical protein
MPISIPKGSVEVKVEHDPTSVIVEVGMPRKPARIVLVLEAGGEASGDTWNETISE